MKTGFLCERGRRIFISMNSSEGFVSFFDEYINSLSKVYILKGGPGTGKSGLMRYFGNQAEKLGYDPLYIHCSSDPDSLDGIIIQEKDMGIFDGTAPHIIEPKYPGVRDEIINLGDFWDSEQLFSRKNEILSLFEKKSLSYKRAMEKLSQCGSLIGSSISKLSGYFDSGASRKKISSIIGKFKEGITSNRSCFIASAVGMKGLTNVMFPSEYKVIYVEKYFGAEYLFLRELEKELSQRKLDVSISRSPFAPAYADAIVVPSERTVFTSLECTAKSKTVKSAKYIKDIPDELLKELSSAKGMSGIYLAGTLDAFSRMRDIHFTLEKIYSSAMNFTEKEDRQKKLVSKVFGI